jgi:ACS family tartrate transporter-like MFS transporter
VLVLALAYFCVVTANYGTEFFMPKFLQTWYGLKVSQITYLVILPPIFALAGQALVGWSSDRSGERRLHTVVPIAIGAVAMALLPLSPGMLPLTMALLITARTGVKAYQPAFWTLPSTFLTSTAAAASVGFINSIGNLGGFAGPTIVGFLYDSTKSFSSGLWVLAGSMALSVTIVLLLFRAGPRPADAPKAAEQAA